jgi:hypothetical protein
MDREECRQLIQDQIDRWVRKHSNRFYREIVLRRLDLDWRPAETLETIRLHDPVDYEVAVLDNAEQLVAEGHIFGIVESAQRDANARKRGMQFYALYPVYDDGTHGRRKNFRAVPEEPEPAEAEPVPASGGTP